MATPGPRYTHQSARITKAIARAFPIRGALRKSILRKLGTPDRRRWRLELVGGSVRRVLTATGPYRRGVASGLQEKGIGARPRGGEG